MGRKSDFCPFVSFTEERSFVIRRIKGAERFNGWECSTTDYWMGRICLTVRRSPKKKINQIRLLWSGRFNLSLNFLSD